jgi:hypothetical protein
MYQKLVTDGVTTVKGIRHAWTYIYVNNRRVEVKFIWVEKIMEVSLYLLGTFGILVISASLVNIKSLFDLSKYPNTLFLLSSGMLFVFFALQQLLPMLFARAIRKRLKDKEQEEVCSSPSSTEGPSSPVQSEEV